jgi:hypothetical protein
LAMAETGFRQRLGAFFIVLRSMPQPVWAVFLIVGFFASSGLSLYAARDAGPGQTLYLAKKAGEKTQYALAFSEERKLKLNLEFAGERARELGRVLETDTQSQKSEESMAKLVQDFKKEIKSAKEQAAKIAGVREKSALPAQPETAATGSPGEAIADHVPPADHQVAVLPGEAEEAAAGEVFSAGLGKEDEGIETSESAETGTGQGQGQIDTAITQVKVGQSEEELEKARQESKEIVVNLEKNISELLEKSETIKEESLDALSQAMEQLNVSQVKGASSSVEVIKEEIGEEDGGGDM